VIAAQKASRTKTPIADIKPASNAISSIASIKRVGTAVFFRRLMVCTSMRSEFMSFPFQIGK
jgi:hypothetical protein